MGQVISEGIGQDPEETPMTVKNPMNNQDEMEDKAVDDHEEQQADPTPTEHTEMTSGRVSKPQHISSKKLVRPHSLLPNKIIILLLMN